MEHKPKPPIVHPPKRSDEERHKSFTKMAIKSATELRKHLDTNSTQANKWLYAPNARKARDYVISIMMDEVEKAAISCMFTSEFILGSQKEVIASQEQQTQDEASRISDNIFQSRIDEMVLWERKLTKQLVDVVGFKRTKQDDYYRHYIILNEIERLTKISTDFSEYHASISQNIKYQLDGLKTDADTIIKKLNPDRCWYVDSVSSTKGGRYKIAPFKKRLNRVIKWMTPNQKLMVGVSYGEYSVQSQSLHPNQVKIKDEHPDMKALDAHFMRVTILASEVVLGAKDVMSMHNMKGYLGDISKMNKSNNYPATLIKNLTQPDIEKGDFVLAHGDLAEVIKVNKSEFGYRGFRVKYLETPPLPNIPVDEMPARYVRLYKKRKPMAEELKALLTKEGVTNPSTRLVNNSIRKTIVHFWSELGGKELAFGNNEAATQKMQEYADKLKNPPK